MSFILTKIDFCNELYLNTKFLSVLGLTPFNPTLEDNEESEGNYIVGLFQCKTITHL